MRSMSKNKALVRTREPAGQDCRQNSLAGNQDSRQNNTYIEDTQPGKIRQYGKCIEYTKRTMLQKGKYCRQEGSSQESTSNMTEQQTRQYNWQINIVRRFEHKIG